MVDQRIAIRKDASLRAEIVIAGAGCIPCVVRNVSKRGAKVDLDAAAQLPGEFQLRAVELNLDTLAKVIWRKGSEIGVKFPVSFPAT